MFAVINPRCSSSASFPKPHLQAYTEHLDSSLGEVCVRRPAAVQSNSGSPVQRRRPSPPASESSGPIQISSAQLNPDLSPIPSAQFGPVRPVRPIGPVRPILQAAQQIRRFFFILQNPPTSELGKSST
ncbi:hypothetical protein CRG98_045702 [Punica granatum]|uniref:Uncharacterized protein n=1 Tax=Punica granatum TaxID=22663 RepID=A0A2I0HQC0_PUNGR|nr:hypothetical protein CRG98_045702 [Punica granatum]